MSPDTERQAGVATLVPPAPGEFTLADVLASVATRLGVDVGRDVAAHPALSDHLRAVVVLVADGLGWHQLVGTDVAPMLSSLGRASTPVRAVLPSTTATNLVSLGTGLPPGRHGVLGYTIVLDDTVFNPLVWRFGLRGGGADARTTVVPEALVPGPTMLERLAAADVATSVVVHPDFLDSGLTRAGMRGGQRLAAIGAEATLATALAAAAGPGPAVVYAHHPDIDTAGHVHGPHTQAWRDAVGALDRLLTQVRRELPRDVAVVVTADHGMVAVPDDDVLQLDDGHPLLDGVALVAGEPRLRSLVVDDPAGVDRVAARFREALDDRAQVVATEEAIAQGWFGPGTSAEHAARLGDVLVASRVGSVAHRRVDPHGGRLAGLHGSLTPAERDVPFLVLTRD